MDWIEGTPIGEYRLLRELERGEGGVLYAARRAEDDHPVVLAVVSLEREGEGMEAIARAGDVRHPGLVRVERIYRFQDLAFVISEQPEGRPLPECFPTHAGEGKAEDGGNGKLDPSDAAALLDRVWQALAYAHGRGVFHGDLRPGDILIRSDGSPVVLGTGWIRFLLRQGHRASVTAPTGPDRDDDVHALARLLYSATGPDRPEETLLRSEEPFDRKDAAPCAVPDAEGAVWDPRPPPEVERPSPAPPAGGFALPGGADRSKIPAIGSGLALACLVLAASLFALVLSLFMTGVLPGTLRTMVAGLERERLDRGLRAAMEPAEGKDRRAALESLLQEEEGALAAPAVHRALAREFLAERRAEAALGEYLLLLRIDPTTACGEEILRLARLLDDAGYAAASDRLLEAVKEHCRGERAAWEALLLQRRFHLHARGPADTVEGLALLLSGPLRDQGTLYEEGRRRLALARGLVLRSMKVPGRLLVTGDFLPDRGDEVVTLHEGVLAVHGDGDGCRVKPGEIPVDAWRIPGAQGDRDRLLLAVPPGKLEAWDPVESGRGPLWIRSAGGRVSCAPLFYTAAGGELRCVLAVSPLHGHGTFLADLPCAPVEGEPEEETTVFTPLECGVVTALLPGTGPRRAGTEILVISLEEAGGRITRVRKGAEAGSWEVVDRFDLRAEIRRACALFTGGEEDPILLAGVDMYLRPGEPGPGASPDLRPGLYRVERTPDPGEAPDPEPEGRPAPYRFVPEKVMAYLPASRGALFLDAVCGRFDGDEIEDAAFLVFFPGEGPLPPETRILLRTGEGAVLWLRSVQARALAVQRRWNGGEGDTLVVDTGSGGLKALSFRRLAP